MRGSPRAASCILCPGHTRSSSAPDPRTGHEWIQGGRRGLAGQRARCPVAPGGSSPASANCCSPGGFCLRCPVPLPLSWVPPHPVPLRKACASTQGLPGAPGETQLMRSDRRSLVADGRGLAHGRPTMHHEYSGAGDGAESRRSLSPQRWPVKV